MAVMGERQKKGIKDEMGKEASPLPANKSSIEFGTEIQTQLVGRPVTGAIYTFGSRHRSVLIGHLFGDIFGCQRNIQKGFEQQGKIRIKRISA